MILSSLYLHFDTFLAVQALNHYSIEYNYIDVSLIDRPPEMNNKIIEKTQLLLSEKYFQCNISAYIYTHCHIRFDESTGSNLSIATRFIFIQKIKNAQCVISAHMVFNLLIVGAFFSACTILIEIHFIVNITLDKVCYFRIRIYGMATIITWGNIKRKILIQYTYSPLKSHHSSLLR